MIKLEKTARDLFVFASNIAVSIYSRNWADEQIKVAEERNKEKMQVSGTDIADFVFVFT